MEVELISKSSISCRMCEKYMGCLAKFHALTSECICPNFSVDDKEIVCHEVITIKLKKENG